MQKGAILWKCVNTFVPHCRYTTTKPTLKIECLRCVPAATCVCQMKQIRQNNIGIFTTLGILATDFYKKMFCLCDNNQFIILRPEKSGLEKIPLILTVYYQIVPREDMYLLKREKNKRQESNINFVEEITVDAR